MNVLLSSNVLDLNHSNIHEIIVKFGGTEISAHKQHGDKANRQNWGLFFDNQSKYEG